LKVGGINPANIFINKRINMELETYIGFVFLGLIIITMLINSIIEKFKNK
jgi:hypothetical protein